jgi:four helix bundle protein
VLEGAVPHSLGMRDHTSLHAWQEAHAVSIGVIALSRDLWKPYAAALFSQLQRASLSTELNIVEGYTFGDSPTFTRHLGIAYGSSVETAELLRITIETDVLPSAIAGSLLSRSRRASRLLLGLLKRRRRLRQPLVHR